jgi:NADH-quinone oxidoreductase subunit N
MGIELQYLLPIITISFFVVTAIVFDALLQNKIFSFVWSIIGLIVVIGTASYTFVIPSLELMNLPKEALITKNMVFFGGYASFFDIVFAGAGLMTILASRVYIQREYKELNEYYSLILIAVSGMMLIGHSNNLLVLFIGIEIMSVTFYVLAGYFRNSIKSIEASLKYFLLGAFATGFLVYGIALLYGATGSLDLNIITSNLIAGKFNHVYFLLGAGLILIGLSFKVAAFPFHQWAPDVYQGSPTVASGFMSSAGKAAAMIAFIIVFKHILPAVNNPVLIKDTHLIQNIIAVLAACTMLLGNFTALAQTNAKRMLAYSSVAHAGYLLIGIASNNSTGWTGVLFYSVAYILMQLGAFIVLSVIERNEQSNLELSDFAGLSRSHPILAALMAVFMLSLAGIPPFAGFFGKYYLFVSAIKADYVWLTIVAVVSSIISMYYYIGLILQMYFKDPRSVALEADYGLARIPLFIAIAGLVIFGVFPSILSDVAYYFF